MNRINIFRALRSGRFFALVALVGLGLLFTASDAKAGCGIPSNTGAAPPIPFLSPHGDDHQEGKESNGPAAIVGLWPQQTPFAARLARARQIHCASARAPALARSL